MTTVDVALCTFRRPQVVTALRTLDAQRVPEDVSLRILVIDNDELPGAREIVEGAARGMRWPVCYIHAPARNISIARNAGLDAAEADWIAFIDDDEEAPEEWISALLEAAGRTGADVVFGPALARFDEDAPAWLREVGYHDNIPQRRAGRVETGHTCNALMRWRDAPWRSERFDLARGRSGGEDTEFFFRIGAMGAKFEIADEAVVHEPVPPERLRFDWILRRRFRMGQSYASSASGRGERAALFVGAAAKGLYCALRAALRVGDATGRGFWVLRGALHAGVCAGCLSLAEPEAYGR